MDCGCCYVEGYGYHQDLHVLAHSVPSRRSSDFNLKRVFLGCKHVLPVMERQGSGAIVNVSSTSGIRWTGAAQVGYASAKAGVIQFSRVVAIEYAPKNIRCNTVIPGQKIGRAHV